MDLFLRETSDRIGRDDPLFRIDALLDWGAFSTLLKCVGSGKGRKGTLGYKGFARKIADELKARPEAPVDREPVPAAGLVGGGVRKRTQGAEGSIAVT